MAMVIRRIILCRAMPRSMMGLLGPTLQGEGGQGETDERVGAGARGAQPCRGLR